MAPTQTGLYFDAEAQLTVLPPGDLQRGFGFAVWRDAAPAFRRFILAHTHDLNRIIPAPEEADCAALIPALLALVPRPDNDYDSRAIAVTAPPSHEGDVLDRHLGYLYGKWLHRMSPLIQDLTTYSPVPVGCHGYIELHELRDWDNADEPWTPSTDCPPQPAGGGSARLPHWGRPAPLGLERRPQARDLRLHRRQDPAGVRGWPRSRRRTWSHGG
ncbi:hypothetical protein [Blastococcus sp. PRF04-17]|uniref:hypothetical protein n=1 Tax=Blastococcus sp. PRF04-17 TaxID=2933797 RepID=UPI001FF3CAF8|nr:hypothetical protein [Blastococcus sp. PRF04-17]UOY03691.1 hypothetical protein MVA48_10320 [Blastococcus sp. PRF04-17]